jgi:hypothetical protein
MQRLVAMPLTLALSPRAGYRIHTSQLEIFLVRRARSVLGVKAAPASRVARFTRKP